MRLAPTRELNRVAVTTRLFLGSTAPTAMSGVSTTATILGGAVSTAARPKRIGALTGVAKPGEGPPGVIGLYELVCRDKRPLTLGDIAAMEEDNTLLVDAASEWRCGGIDEEVERDREIVRERGKGGLKPDATGVAASGTEPFVLSSSSVH